MPRLAAIALCITCSASTIAAFAQLKPKASSGGLTAPAAIDTAVPAAPSVANVQKEAEGKLAAQGWLVLLDRRDWGTAWETSAAMFRTTVPLASWMDGIPKVREPLGRFIERTPTESIYKTTLQGKPDGEYVSVVFESKFDARALEEIVTTVRDVDGRWRVTGYSVR